jgi:hypothetical protein
LRLWTTRRKKRAPPGRRIREAPVNDDDMDELLELLVALTAPLLELLELMMNSPSRYHSITGVG